VELSTEIAAWSEALTTALEETADTGAAESDAARKQLMDRLGNAVSRHRVAVYQSGISGTTTVGVADLTRLCDVAMGDLDDTIHRSRPEDGLYHAYNLIRFGPDGSSTSPRCSRVRSPSSTPVWCRLTRRHRRRPLLERDVSGGPAKLGALPGPPPTAVPRRT
jgi:hypothetical protein